MKYLQGDRIKLCKFEERSMTPEYMSWLNDPDVNKFLDTGRIPISKEEVFAPKDDKNLMFMIMANFYLGDINRGEVKDKDYIYYIGTCSLHKIDWISRKGEIGYMIGNKSYWGHGVGTEVVRILTDYGFNRLNLNKLTAGVVGGNVGSVEVLERNGYRQFAKFEQDHFIDGQYIDTWRFHNFQSWHREFKAYWDKQKEEVK